MFWVKMLEYIIASTAEGGRVEDVHLGAMGPYYEDIFCNTLRAFMGDDMIAVYWFLGTGEEYAYTGKRPSWEHEKNKGGNKGMRLRWNPYRPYRKGHHSMGLGIHAAWDSERGHIEIRVIHMSVSILWGEREGKQ